MGYSLCMCMHMLYSSAKDLAWYLLGSPFMLFLFTFIFVVMLIGNFYYSKEFWEKCLFPRDLISSAASPRYDYGVNHGNFLINSFMIFIFLSLLIRRTSYLEGRFPRSRWKFSVSHQYPNCRSRFIENWRASSVESLRRPSFDYTH